MRLENLRSIGQLAVPRGGLALLLPDYFPWAPKPVMDVSGVSTEQQDYPKKTSSPKENGRNQNVPLCNHCGGFGDLAE
jgi:hypothetical protein